MPNVRKDITAGILCLGALAISGSATALTSVIKLGGQQVSFVNPPDADADGYTEGIGVAATSGFSYTYTDVLPASLPDVDAKVTLVSIAGGTVVEVDEGDNDATEDRWINLWIDVTSPGGVAELKVEFFASGTSTPVTLRGLRLNVSDIDNSQFAEFDGPTSYRVATGSKLTTQTSADTPSLSAGTVRFTEPTGESGSGTDPLFVADLSYGATSSLTVRFGVTDIDDASFGLDFSPASWAGAETEEVSLAPDSLGEATGFSPLRLMLGASALMAVGLVACGFTGAVGANHRRRRTA